MTDIVVYNSIICLRTALKLSLSLLDDLRNKDLHVCDIDSDVYDHLNEVLELTKIFEGKEGLN